ncbi:MAG: 30S ribosomal protein S16 [Anaerolineales bacterium]
MLRIRLRRVGRKKQPSYRVVIAESTAPRDGKFVEVIGFYNPRTEPETFQLQEDRALHWLSVGAQPSEAVARLFRTHGTLERFERLKAGESVDVLVEEAEAAVEVTAETEETMVEAPPASEAELESVEAPETPEPTETTEPASEEE